MTDPKYTFTDDEIVKALELCSKLDFSFKECDKCPYKGECGTKDGNMPADALALIKHQRAEIERLNTVLSNEAIVPPVKIGQTVYSVLIYDPEDELDKSFIEEYTVDGVAYIEGEWYVFDERDHELYKVGTECCQLTRADAEKVLAERGKK